MRVIFAAFIAVVVLGISTDASSVVSEPSIATGPALLYSSNNMGTRSLRADKYTVENEERGALTTIVTKWKTWIKPNTMSKMEAQAIEASKNLPTGLRKLFKARGSTDSAFEVLKLKTLDTRKLYENSGLPAYVRYSELLSKVTKSKDTYGIATLQKNFIESELTLIINAGLMTNKGSLAWETAHRLRAGRFASWLDKRTKTWEVFQILKAGTNKLSDADREGWRIYVNQLNKALDDDRIAALKKR
ncbi:unnamed protein product [Phytophthora fragariaefolia]|uniref:Unnamed protein product n=1 Tax=Phytophthora fragariaefolia TaxID=1490495 RepID=A0A9W6YLF0_9STRA|nr:unnamed protein product [Phytophthora fragariaefolia]